MGDHFTQGHVDLYINNKLKKNYKPTIFQHFVILPISDNSPNSFCKGLKEYYRLYIESMQSYYTMRLW